MLVGRLGLSPKDKTDPALIFLFSNPFGINLPSVDKTLTFVKYATDEMPSSVASLDTKQGPYSHEEILEILSTEEWTSPIEEL